jgi:uncharacterized protein (DUF433 family)
MDRGRITVDPNRMRGLACIRDTRVTVVAVLGCLDAGREISEVLRDFPYLGQADLEAALEFAARTTEGQEQPAVAPS